MGIPITQKTVTLEKRLKSIHINRNLVSNEIAITIESETGYYDTNSVWKKVEDERFYLNGDIVLVLMGLNKNSLSYDKLGELIEYMAYGIISGEIKTTATFNVTALDSLTGEPITTSFSVIKGDRVLHLGYSNIPLKTPVYLGVKVLIQSEGYEPVELNYPLVQGDVNITVYLNRIAQ